jgi:hypothetical protein
MLGVLVTSLGGFLAVVMAFTTLALRSGKTDEWAGFGPPAHRARARPARPKAPAANPVPTFARFGVDDSGYALAFAHTGEVADRSSLEALRRAYRTRADRGLAELRGQLERLDTVPTSELTRTMERSRLLTWIATLLASEGRFDEADDAISRAIEAMSAPGMPPEFRANLLALRGVEALRRGEAANCVACLGPSSCILPLAPEAVHRRRDGSAQAARDFAAYLRVRPEDLSVRWLLNVAHMTLGTYPDGVPREFLVPPGVPGGGPSPVRFANVAAEAGLGVRGPDMAGGAILDDFDGDGLPDAFTTSFDADLGAALFVNRGDGTFEDRSASAGLEGQALAVNASHADFDNDGDLDVVLVRGGWEGPSRLSLLRNDGSGRFDDVTVAAGLDAPIPSHCAAWGDYDNDGLVDLYVTGEFLDGTEGGLFAPVEGAEASDPRNRCRLYKNRGDGTFRDVAGAAGVLNGRYAKGAAWGDYDDDGRLDLFVSNLGENRLYHNEGDGTFRDVAPDLGLTEPSDSFACWFWDYDNDGRLDLFVCGFDDNMEAFVAERLGWPILEGDFQFCRLYRNLGPDGFLDVTERVGLHRVMMAMGAGVGDIDNDGYLDFYIGTGQPAFSKLVPNLMFRNVEGRKFRDVTPGSGTGHLQKGHGVAFADYDLDGDLDLLAQLGGAVPGDRAHNALFRNPGAGHHWLRLRLVGTRSNRSAFGARIRVDRVGPDGARRSVFRQVGGGSSYGGNALAETIGLGDAGSVESVTITWPATGRTQRFEHVPADRAFVVTEGRDALEPDAAGPGRAGPAVR